MKAQEAAISLNEAAHLPRPSSVPLDAYSRPSLFLSPAPASPLQQQHQQARASSLSLSPQPFSLTTAVAGEGPNAAYRSPTASPFRGSFLAGANQDLLAAGALASCGILNSSSGLNSSSRYTLLGAKVGMSPATSLPASLPDGMHQVGAAATIPAAPAATLSRVPVPMVSQLMLACWVVLD